MPGPPPKPTSLRLLNGNPGKRPINNNEPTPPVEMPRCPAHLNDVAKKEWRRISKDLLRLNLLSKIDGTALAIYCEAYSRWVEACDQIRQFGMVLRSPKQAILMQSPYLPIANKAIEQMKAMLLEFGMTPASRSRIDTSKLDGTGDDDDRGILD